MDSKFNDLCESFGVIKQTKRIMYPRQINLSEEFLQALKNEYYRLTLEEDAEKPIQNRPQKFVKALQFHVADLEKNKEVELEALRNMMDEAKAGTHHTDKGTIRVRKIHTSKQSNLVCYKGRKRGPRRSS